MCNICGASFPNSVETESSSNETKKREEKKYADNKKIFYIRRADFPNEKINNCEGYTFPDRKKNIYNNKCTLQQGASTQPGNKIAKMNTMNVKAREKKNTQHWQERKFVQ